MISDPQKYIRSLHKEQVELVLELFDERNDRVGYLTPLTKSRLNDDDLIELLTRWRNHNMQSFLTTFIATPERTRRWLKNVVLSSSTQMLFLIFDLDDNLTGHLGFKNLTQDDVLSDNAIKAGRSKNPKIMVYAHRRIIQWLFDNTSINLVRGEVFSDNATSIIMNKQIGFVQVAKSPLLKIINENNEEEWIRNEENEEVGNRFLHELVISRSDWADISISSL